MYAVIFERLGGAELKLSTARIFTSPRWSATYFLGGACSGRPQHWRQLPRDAPLRKQHAASILFYGRTASNVFKDKLVCGCSNRSHSNVTYKGTTTPSPRQFKQVCCPLASHSGHIAHRATCGAFKGDQARTRFSAGGQLCFTLGTNQYSIQKALKQYVKQLGSQHPVC